TATQIRPAGISTPAAATLEAMAGDDDLDWLYRRDRRRPGQRPPAPRSDEGGTRVFSPHEVAELQQPANSGSGASGAQGRTPVRPVPAPPLQSPGRPRKRRRPGRKIAAVLVTVIVLF